MHEQVPSWGNVVRAGHEIVRLKSRHDAFPRSGCGLAVLPFGNGRSYGDSCLNDGGGLVRMRSLDRFIAFDPLTGVMACEAGVLLADLLQLTLPEGWFLPVVPSTAFITVGGAIANDVHGSNHHIAGTFARHVRRMEILRSDDQRIVCSDTQHPDWFAATAGGLGLTGIVTWAELQLRRIPGRRMTVESMRCSHLDEFLELSAESDRSFEYTVATVDPSARATQVGRGVLQRANHVPGTVQPKSHRRQWNVPFTPVLSLVNRASIWFANTLRFRMLGAPRRRTEADLESVCFAHDRLRNANRLYGARGFYQYHCVLPEPQARESVGALLQSVGTSAPGAARAVMKVFGSIRSPGMLSFPQPGISLAVDFPNRGTGLERLFRSLDDIVRSAGGRLYAAKDARMPPDLFRSGYPRLQEFARYLDPACSSSFWRRMVAEE